jgi:hypothetical protein
VRHAPGLLATILTLLTVACSLGCSPGDGGEAAARQEIEQMLGEYLPVLAEAYAESDPLRLAPWVAEKEIARVHKRIEELADQGSTLEPTFHSVTVEDVRVWGNANAIVTTVEVWDLVSRAAGTGMVIQEVQGQTNRVRYQLKKGEGRWRVLFRTIAEK